MAFFSVLDTFHLAFSMYLVYSFILQALGFTKAAANVLWYVFFSVQLYLHFIERRQGASRYGLRCPSSWVVVEDSLFPGVGINSGTGVVLLTYPTRF